MMLFLTPQFVTENTKVHNKKYQWQSTMTLNLCAQIKYFFDNIGHAIHLLSIHRTKMNRVDRIRNTLIL